MLQLPHPFLRAIDVGGQVHVVLKMVKVVTHELYDDPILFHHLLLQFYHFCPRRLELLLQGLDMTKLLGLHDHHIVHTVHHIIRLEVKSVDHLKWIHSLTYHGLDICHRMVQTGTNDPNQLTTHINHP